jgi:hypothetical protein
MTGAGRIPSPLLSFCIPTYNRVESVVPLVKRLLLSPSREFEIIVSDNGSTDDTLAQLNAIDDQRLIVLQSKINRGALYNQVNVLVQGNGAYSALLLDKDSVDPAFIPSFLDFLRLESPLTGYCEYHLAAGSSALVFPKGSEALRGVCYSCHHPSGYFFRKADLREIRCVDRFTEHDSVGNFPFEFMQAELAMRGPAAIFREPVFIPETLEAARAVKSFTINAMKEDAFFLPKGRLNTAVRFSLHILGLALTDRAKRALVFDRFAQGLGLATVDYRNIMANEAICDHYHIETRQVGRLDLVPIAVRYFRGFVQQMKNAPPGQERFKATDFLLDMARRVARRLGRGFATPGSAR